MRGKWRLRGLVTCGLIASLSVGCGTTRMTDTTRSATEMLLISQAIDRSVNKLDFTPLAGKKVFFEEKILDGTTDKNYLASSLRAKMLADGCLVIEEKNKATYVVEARAGCVGTDKHSLLVGVPQMNLPTIMPGQPPMIPEIPLIKSSDQQGVAKILVFAYNRVTGQAVWQSGVQESVSRAKDSWVCGAGPFHKGTIQHRNDNLEQLDVLGVIGDSETQLAANGRTGVTQAAHFAPTEPVPSEIQTVNNKTESEKKPEAKKPDTKKANEIQPVSGTAIPAVSTAPKKLDDVKPTSGSSLPPVPGSPGSGRDGTSLATPASDSIVPVSGTTLPPIPGSNK